MSADINFLLHKDSESLEREKRVKRLNLIAILFLVGIGIISLILFLLIQVTDTSSIKNQQTDILLKVSKYKDTQAKLFVLDDRINNVQQVLEKRKDMSIILNTLLIKTPPNLSIDDLEIDSKAITISAQSTSLFHIGEYINNLTDMVRKKEIISSLTLTSLVFDENKNSYQVSVKAEL